MNSFTLILGILMLLLALIIYIAGVKRKYSNIFTVFAGKGSNTCIGPWNISMSVEHPWVAQLFIAKPLPTVVAQFLVAVIRAKSLWYEDVCVGFGTQLSVLDANIQQAKSADQGSQASTWQSISGRLGELIPWGAPIVQDYINSHDNALPTLWAGGFYAFATDYYSGGHGVDDLWNKLFSTTLPKPPQDSDDCADTGSTAMSGAMGGAGLGLMAGGPVGGLIGGLVGAFGSIFAKGQSKCL